MKTNEELKKEFIKDWQKDDSFPLVVDIADWWIEKFKSELSSLASEVEGKRKIKFPGNSKALEFKWGYNEALTKVSELIARRIK